MLIRRKQSMKNRRESDKENTKSGRLKLELNKRERIHITNIAIIFKFELEFSSISQEVYYHSKNYSVLFAFNFC